MDRLLDSLFPTADSIPETWRLGGPMEQREYLVRPAGHGAQPSVAQAG